MTALRRASLVAIATVLVWSVAIVDATSLRGSAVVAGGVTANVTSFPARHARSECGAPHVLPFVGEEVLHVVFVGAATGHARFAWAVNNYVKLVRRPVRYVMI